MITPQIGGIAAVLLPVPGRLSGHHADHQTVWYHGQDGEFVITDRADDLRPVTDGEGNSWSVKALRDMAAAALAAAAEVERRRRPVGDTDALPLASTGRVKSTPQMRATRMAMIREWIDHHLERANELEEYARPWWRISCFAWLHAASIHRLAARRFTTLLEGIERGDWDT